MQAQTANQMLGDVDERAADVSGGLSDGLGEAAGRGARGGRAAEIPGRLAGGARLLGRGTGLVSTAIDAWNGGRRIGEALNQRTVTDVEGSNARIGSATLGTAGTIVGGTVGAIGGAKLGGIAGAAIGSCFCPLVGTFVGGVVGGAIGAIAGGFLGGEGGQRAGEAIGRTAPGRAVGQFVSDRFPG